MIRNLLKTLSAAVAALSIPAAMASPTDLGTVGGAAPGTRIGGGRAGEQSGTQVFLGGDFNGDGYDDLLIGAPAVGNGRAYLVMGSGNTVPTLNLAAPGPNVIVFEGVSPEDRAGASVAGGRDINADGFDDIIIGAPGADALGRGGAGEAYVVLGSANPPSIVQLSNVGTTVPGIRIYGRSEFDAYGTSVSLVDDVTRDRLPEIGVGAPLGSPNGVARAGEVFLLAGRRSPTTVVIDAAAPPAASAFLEGAQVDRLAGSSLGSGGDFNGDGLGDFMIGAPGTPGLGLRGEAYLIGGEATLVSPVSLANVGTTISGLTLIGASPEDQAGFSVGTAGDHVGMGLDALLIGAPNGLGRAYYLVGQTGVPASFELSDLGLVPSAGRVFVGTAAGDGAGTAVGLAGDIDNDGLDDFQIGAPGFDANAQDLAGAAYEIDSLTTLPPILEVPLSVVGSQLSGERWQGSTISQRAGASVGRGRGDFNGDGVEDQVIGLPGANLNGLPTSGVTAVVFGQLSTPEAITYTRRISGGNAPPKKFPPVRFVLDYDNGGGIGPQSRSVEHVTLIRSPAQNLTGGNIMGTLPLHWMIDTEDRTNATLVSAEMQITQDELFGFPIKNVRAHSSSSPVGPWTEIPVQSVNTRARRVHVSGISIDVDVPTYIGLAVNNDEFLTSSALATNIAAGTELPQNLAGEADANFDGQKNAADVVTLVNNGL